MCMTKNRESKKQKIKNQLELWLFCMMIGATAGALVWILLKVIAVGTEIVWKWIPERYSIPGYKILICVVGAAIIGLFRKKFGDYPEELETVMGKVKKDLQSSTQGNIHRLVWPFH